MKTKYIFLSVLALAFTACEKDFFSTSSPSAMDVSVFKSAELTEQAVGAIYNTFGEDKSFRNRLCGGYVALNTDIERCSKTGGQAREEAIYALSKGTGDLSTSNGKDPWAYLNSAIERCNVVVDGILQYSDTTDETFRYYLGEALTLRAFCYLEMIKLWGDVPACFKSFDGNDLNDLYVKKTDRNVVYEQIRKDLLYASELMPWSSACPGKAANFTGRASKALALGLLARVDMMYAGLAMRPNTFTEGGTSDCSIQYNLPNAADRQALYQEAVWACAQVINNEDYKLQPSFEQVWRDFCADKTDYNQSEFIWALPFLDGARGQVLSLTGMKVSSRAPEALINMMWVKDGDASNAKVQGMIVVVPTFYLTYDAKDTRRDVTVCPFQWEYDNGSSYNNGGAFPGTPTAQKKLYQKLSDASALGLGKLRPEWMVREYSSNEDCLDMPVLRYSDILLMFAEAAIGSKEGNAPSDLYGLNALEQFNKVRKRAGVKEKASLTFADIVDERAFEFCGENIRKYDLMRWGMLKDKLVATAQNLKDLQYGEGKYTTRNDSVYLKFKQDNSYAKVGDAYVIDSIYGLFLGETRPESFDKANGWVAKSFYQKTDESSGAITYHLYDKETDKLLFDLYSNADEIDWHQYWPIFDVNVNASNGTLWNDYHY